MGLTYSCAPEQQQEQQEKRVFMISGPWDLQQNVRVEGLCANDLVMTLGANVENWWQKL